jgi:DNA-binding CsgD family transcriptional regulator
MEILDLVINGLTNREIAQKLHRTERTVEYHRNHLMHKFEAKTAADLVKRAILSGMV